MIEISEIAILIFVLFLVVEIFLRIFPNFLPAQVKYILTLKQDDDLLWKLKPRTNVKFTNADDQIYNVRTFPFETSTFKDYKIGFRDHDIPMNPYAVAVGDSFTFGDECNFEDSWPVLLEKMLGSRVVNLGVSGYSQLQEEIIINKYASKLKPKIVLLGFYANDYEGDYGFSMINRTIHKLNFIISNLLSIRTIKTLLLRQGDEHQVSPYRTSGNEIQFMFKEQKLRNFFSTNSPQFTEGGRLSRESVLRMEKSVSDSKLVVVLLPAKESIYKDVLPYKDVDYDSILDTMKEHLKNNKIGFVDVRDAFKKKRKEGKLLYTIHSSHLNKEGNNIVAEEICRYLIRS